MRYSFDYAGVDPYDADEIFENDDFEETDPFAFKSMMKSLKASRRRLLKIDKGQSF